MYSSVVGILTIGQSPRIDVIPTFESILGSNVEIVESGCLDNLSETELLQIQPDCGTKTTYVSRLRNGSSIRIDKEKLMPYLKGKLKGLEEQADVIIMLCTGDFSSITSTKPIIYPDKILTNTIKAVKGSGVLGLIIPLEEQRAMTVKKWDSGHYEILSEAASPYEESDVLNAAKCLKEKGAEIIILDCMGYHEQHKLAAITGSGLPVILPRTLVASIGKEYLAV